MTLMQPPLPAASRPSKSTTSRSPEATSQSFMKESSSCNRAISFSYTFFGNRSALRGTATPPGQSQRLRRKGR